MEYVQVDRDLVWVQVCLTPKPPALPLTFLTWSRKGSSLSSVAFHLFLDLSFTWFYYVFIRNHFIKSFKTPLECGENNKYRMGVLGPEHFYKKGEKMF